ncbi:MAG: hypothetical protein M3065_12445 [Actinomycetota bacterium]|nr:hypothetical protein [Actinomycetota bacterium]
MWRFRVKLMGGWLLTVVCLLGVIATGNSATTRPDHEPREAVLDHRQPRPHQPPPAQWALSLYPTSAEVLVAIREGIVIVPERGPWGGVPQLIRFDGG